MIYYSDTKADANNLSFGYLYRKDIPSHYALNMCLGLGPKERFYISKEDGYVISSHHRANSKQTVRYLQAFESNRDKT